MRRIKKCGSTKLTDAQTRWAMVELELASTAFALEKCRMYCLGAKEIVIYNDQQALQGIAEKSLVEIQNNRIIRILDRMSCFDYRIEYIPGNKNIAADTLSRNNCGEPEFPDVANAIPINRSVKSVRNVQNEKYISRDLQDMAREALNDS